MRDLSQKPIKPPGSVIENQNRTSGMCSSSYEPQFSDKPYTEVDSFLFIFAPSPSLQFTLNKLKIHIVYICLLNKAGYPSSLKPGA